MTLLRWTAVTGYSTLDLPDVLASTIGLTWGEATGGELTYSLHGERAALLDARVHEVPLLRAQMAVGDEWVPVGGDLVARQVQADREAEAPTVQVSLVDAVADALDKVTLWPKDGAAVDADGNRLFTAATAGSIVQTWLAEAQARGEAQRVTCWATPTHDSWGNPWTTESTPLRYGHEDQSLAAVIESLWASGMCDWYTIPGGELVLLNPEASQEDRSGTVILHAGADVGHTPQTQGSGETAHVVRVIGDDGAHVVIEDPELPVGPTGKRSAIVSGAGATDEGTLRTIGEAWIAQHNRAADHLTRELVWQGKFLPLVDYYPGDHITAPGVTGAMEKCRVSEITLTTEGNELTGDSAISLNGKYSDPLLRLTKRQNGLIGASKTGGGNNTRPRDDRPDGRTPATPEGLTVTSEAYTLGTGEVRAVAQAVWAPVTTDTRAVAMEVTGYQVRWRPRPEGRWRLRDAADAEAVEDNLAAGEVTEWQVRAVGPVEMSGWSGAVLHTADADDTPPPVPSPPTVVAESLATSVWTWDGFTAAGGRMPLDTDRVELAITAEARRPAEVTDADVWTGPQMRRPFNRPQSVTIAGRTGTMYGYLRAVDTTGNTSAWTEPVEVTVRSTVDVDEIDGAITDAIADADARIDQITDEVIPGLRGDMDAADQAAQAAAAQAASDAAAAQQAAEQAVSDAAAAAGRSTTVWQATAPDDTGVLWIKTPDNTPHVWDGANWVAVTDQAVLDAAADASEARAAAQAAQEAADAAQQRAEEAVGLANAAQSAAEAAQATADGAQSDADQALADAAAAAGAAKAVRSPEPPADKTVLWIDSDNGDRPHLWNGSVWAVVTDQRLTDAADAAGDAQQAADAAQAAADAAAQGVDEVRELANAAQQAAEDAAKDAAEAAGKSAVVWQPTAPTDETVLWIKTPGDTPHVHDGTGWVEVTDQRILDAAEAADDARNAAQAAQEAADAAQAAADNAQSTADSALARAITADGRVTVSSRVPVAADGAGKPVGALWQTYSGDELVAFYRWDGTKWRAMPLSRSIIPLLDIGAGTFGTLDGARLKAGSIATNRLAVTDWTNHVENPAPELRPAGEDDGWSGAVTTAADGTAVVARTGASNGYGTTYNDHKTPILEGDTAPIRVTAEVRGPGLNARVGVRWQMEGGSGGWSYGGYVATSSEWQAVEATLTPPEGAVWFIPLVQVMSTNTTDPVEFRNVTARWMTPSVLIEDGAITAPKITASEELTAKIASFLKVKAGQIDVNDLWADSAFLGLAKANTLQVGDIRPGDLPSAADELIRDPLWFDADVRAEREATMSGGWLWREASGTPVAATGGQTHVAHLYTPSASGYPSVDLIEPANAVPVNPGEVISLDMTTYHASAGEGSRCMLQAVFVSATGQNTYSSSYAAVHDGTLPSSSIQTRGAVVTVPDGAVSMWVRIVVDYLSQGSSWWKVLQVSARKGMGTRGPKGGFEVTPQNLTAYSPTGDASGVYPRFNISADASEDVVAVRDTDGEIVASMTNDGAVTGTTVESAGDMLVGGRPLAGRLLDQNSDPGLLDLMPWGGVAEHRGGYAYGTSPRYSRETGFSLLEYTEEPGRRYAITFSGRLSSTQGSCYVSLRRTTSGLGSQPALPRPNHSQFLERRGVATSGTSTGFSTVSSRWTYNSGSASRSRLLVVAEPGSDGTKDVSPLDWVVSVEDVGPIVESTGKTVAITGSSSTIDPGGEAGRYTTTWAANGQRVYNGSGQPHDPGGPASDLVGGQSPAYTAGGNQRSMVVFGGQAISGDEKGSGIVSALTGAVIESVRIRHRLHNAHTTSGVRMVVRPGGSTSVPSTLSSPSSSTKTLTGWSIGQTRTDYLPAGWFSSSRVSLVYGPNETTGSRYYGRVYGTGSSSAPQITITYRR